MLSSREIIEATRLTRQLGADIYNPFDETPSSYSGTGNNTNEEANNTPKYVLRKAKSGEFQLVTQN